MIMRQVFLGIFILTGLLGAFGLGDSKAATGAGVVAGCSIIAIAILVRSIEEEIGRENIKTSSTPEENQEK